MNVVVGNPIDCPDPTKKTDCRGIDFVYHAPFLDIYIRCAELIVGGMDRLPTGSLRDQLKTNEAAPAEAWQRSIMLSSVSLKVKRRFQFENEVFCIESLTGNDVHAICFFGPSKGNIRVFEVDIVSRLMMTTLHLRGSLLLIKDDKII